MTTNGRFRDPEGRFIARSTMLSAWMPTLCLWAWGGVVEEALKALARFCEHKAGHEFANLGRGLTEDGFEVGVLNAESFLRPANRWLKRRDVLLRAVEEIRQT